MCNRGVFFSSVADKRLSSAPPETLPALPYMPCVLEGLQSMTVAGQTIEVIITFRKSSKNWPKRWAGVYRSSM